ncbi:cation:proton antiporter [Hydrogenobacter thermophilus]|uniref:cation:proton antiporter n=1 Tax=Hydrogenobacter thermophilus TaxID=940 RepID=UPI0030FCE8F5
MHESHKLIYSGIILLFMFSLAYSLSRLKVPHIVSFMLAGLLAKGFVPVEYSHTFALLEYSAIALLFFFIGLEYSFERLAGMLRVIKPGLIDFILNFFPILALAYLLSKDLILSLVLASALYPSSTAITVKLLMDYKRLIFPEADFMIGLLIFEDLISIILLSVLSGLAAGGDIGYQGAYKSIATMLVVFVAFYLLRDIFKRAFDYMEKKLDENLLVFFIFGLLLLAVGLSHQMGISEALVVFMLGVLVPEDSRVFKYIETSLTSLRELSMGIFFFFFTYKMQMESSEGLFIAFLLMLLVLTTKFASTFLASLAYGFDKRVALRASLSFLQRGEFSLIFASLYPPAKVVVFIVVLFTSILGSFNFVSAPKLTDFLFPKKRSSKAPPQAP